MFRLEIPNTIHAKQLALDGLVHVYIRQLRPHKIRDYLTHMDKGISELVSLRLFFLNRLTFTKLCISQEYSKFDGKITLTILLYYPLIIRRLT